MGGLKRKSLFLLLIVIVIPLALRAQGSPQHLIVPGVWFFTGDTNGYSNTVVI